MSLGFQNKMQLKLPNIVVSHGIALDSLEYCLCKTYMIYDVLVVKN
jgi:hypothetical protein